MRMKKVLIALSILFLFGWIAGLFIGGLSPAIHILLVTAILFFIKSVMIIPESVT